MESGIVGWLVAGVTLLILNERGDMKDLEAEDVMSSDGFWWWDGLSIGLEAVIIPFWTLPLLDLGQITSALFV